LDRVFITGGAGFIGSNIVGALLQHEYEVTAYDNLLTGRAENIIEFEDASGFRFVKGDILDFERLSSEMEGSKYVLHQAALPSVARSVKDPRKTNKINVEGTINVLLAAREVSASKVVFASSSSVYGDTPVLPKIEDMPYSPLSPYAISKTAGELYCEVFNDLYDMSTISLRYFNVYGPKQNPEGDYAAAIPRFIESALLGKPITIFGNGEQTRDFSYVEDVVAANILAMKSKSQGIMNIAYGGRTSINMIAESIVNLTGSNSEIVHAEPRPGDIKDSFADITKAKNTIGYLPEKNISQGLISTVDWFRKLLEKS
jgi:UDP-glucose 4-epimerase